MILDIHTHRAAPQFEALVCIEPGDFNPIDGQLYSVGIHPWRTRGSVPEDEWALFGEVCRHPQVVAIGECGVDLLKGGPLYSQIQAMRRQIKLSEELGKPLVVHNVHAHDIIIGLKRDIKPEQPWMIHGFRGKPTVARMLTDAGIWVSFGPRFNERAVAEFPVEMMLAETDDSDVAIADVISLLSALKTHDLTEEIARNSRRFLNLPL